MKKKEKKSFTYPEKITEVFDGADFHIKYCLSFIKRYLHGDTLEVGAGCGSFTRHYENKKISSITLTEIDKKRTAEYKPLTFPTDINQHTLINSYYKNFYYNNSCQIYTLKKIGK